MSLQAGWNKIFHFFLGLTTDFFFFSIDSRFLKPRPSISLLSLFPSQRSRQPLHTPPLGCARTSQLSGVDGVRGPMRAFAVDRKKRSLPWNEEALGWARRRQWHSTPLPGESHEWRGLVGCSPWGREESDTTDRATSLSLFTFMNWRRKWQPTPVFLPGESQGRGSLVGCRLWGRTESDTTEAT